MIPSGAVAALVTIAALASYVNHRLLRLPATIGMMVLALSASLVLLLAARFSGIETGPVLDFIRGIDLRVVLLDVLLPYLLFAGALHVDVDRLREQVAPVTMLSTLGVALSTLVTGGLVWSAARALGIGLGLAQGLLFGADGSKERHAAILARLDRIDHDFGAALERTESAMAAYIGELDDRLQRGPQIGN